MKTEQQLRELVRKRMAAAGQNQQEYAAAHGYSQQYLSDFLNSRRAPGKAIVQAEGFRAVTYYVEDR